tara:strand:- start:4719 stop:5435 length:717 start_codon:yes stop_codon:yes gene_type:complete
VIEDDNSRVGNVYKVITHNRRVGEARATGGEMITNEQLKQEIEARNGKARQSLWLETYQERVWLPGPAMPHGLHHTENSHKMMREHYVDRPMKDSDHDTYAGTLRRYHASNPLRYSEEGWYSPGDIIYVTNYRIEEHYGGPEEGGWYYTTKTPFSFTVLEYKNEDSLLEAERVKVTRKVELGETVHTPDYEALGGDETVSATFPEGYIPSGWVASQNWVVEVEPRLGFYTDNEERFYE